MAICEITKREREVIQLIAQGMTDREIANSLIISLRTAQNHVRHILDKTSMPNRAALVLYGLYHGLISLEDAYFSSLHQQRESI
jgi:DNA-binding CsgD family transcriptional regulator